MAEEQDDPIEEQIFREDEEPDESGEDSGAPRRTYERRSSGRTPYQIWLISYSDFMTILTIFFLAMYGYTYLDAASMLFPKQAISYSAFSEMVQKLQGEVGGELKVQDQVDKVTIEVGEKILFRSGSAALNSTADQALKGLARSLMLVKGDIIVQGHTDNIPISGGRFNSNWELSAARAFSVIQALTEKGVPADRLAAWGFGENRPMVSNETVEERAQNRRIEIVVLKTNVSSGG